MKKIVQILICLMIVLSVNGCSKKTVNEQGIKITEYETLEELNEKTNSSLEAITDATDEKFYSFKIDKNIVAVYEFNRYDIKFDLRESDCPLDVNISEFKDEQYFDENYNEKEYVIKKDGSLCTRWTDGDKQFLLTGYQCYDQKMFIDLSKEIWGEIVKIEELETEYSAEYNEEQSEEEQLIDIDSYSYRYEESGENLIAYISDSGIRIVITFYCEGDKVVDCLTEMTFTDVEKAQELYEENELEGAVIEGNKVSISSSDFNFFTKDEVIQLLNEAYN